jgi:hypothetical protein
MSTRSTIIIQDAPDAFRGIYCHFDGYPEGVGKVLDKHYAERSKVSQLIDLGDISSLDKKVAPGKGSSHSYDSPVRGCTVAYGRDRSEEGTEFKTGKTLSEVTDQIGGSYVYVFGLDDTWTCDGLTIAEAIKADSGEDDEG